MDTTLALSVSRRSCFASSGKCNSDHYGNSGGVLKMTSYENNFGYTDATTVSAVMVSLQNVGAFLSAICIFPVSERFGRKRTMMFACAVFCCGVILQIVPSHSLVCFYIGRVVSGLGLGAATAIAPCYNAETAPKEIRAMLFWHTVAVRTWSDDLILVSRT